LTQLISPTVAKFYLHPNQYMRVRETLTTLKEYTPRLSEMLLCFT